MNETEWHAPAGLLARFAHDPAGLDDVTASSIETHLVACPACRALVAAAAPLDVTASWAAVADRIDRPRPSLVERLLERLGIDDGFARLVGATPALQLSGLAAITGLSVVAAVLGRSANSGGPFLVFAPLVPLAAVAATFAPAGDPAGETGVATALHGAGLAIRRAAIVLGTTFALLALAGLTVPGQGLTAATWVLPALALAVGSLALGTWWRIEVAVGGLAAVWLCITTAAWVTAGRRLSFTESPIFGATGQVAALAATLLAVAILVARSDRFATLEALR
jgi:hypothetical protein